MAAQPAGVTRHVPGVAGAVRLKAGRYNPAMLAAIEVGRDEVARICRRHCVRRLSVFGSATSERFDPSRSDVDLLVEFEKMAPSEHAGHYFGLQEDLEALLRRPVDLVEPGPIRNPYFKQSVEASKVLLFEAA